MEINLYTDGACLGNPGDGAWAVLFEGHEKCILGKQNQWRSGFIPDTTNNEAEVTAALMAMDLSVTKADFYDWPAQEKRIFNVYSDSQYVVKGFNKEWKIQTHKGIWTQIDWYREKYAFKYEWKFFWVKGHANNKLNIVVDGLAKMAAQGTKLPDTF